MPWQTPGFDGDQSITNVRRRPAVEWRVSDAPGGLSRGGGGDGGAGRGDAGRHGGRARLAARAPAALHRRHLGAGRGPALARPLPGLSPPARRRVHLPRAGPAGRLRDARPQPPRPRRARLRLAARGMGDPRARRVRRARRAARRGASASGWCAPTGRRSRTAARPRTRSPRSASRVRRWVTFHGVAINVEPDLGHFAGIVPCGIRGHGVTSLVDLGAAGRAWPTSTSRCAAFDDVFGRRDSPEPVPERKLPSVSGRWQPRHASRREDFIWAETLSGSPLGRATAAG